MLAFSLKWDWTCQVTFIISQKLSQKKAISYKWLGFYSLIFSQVLPGTSDNQKLKRSDSHSKLIFSKIILNFMAPQNHLEWECYLSTCLRLNKLKVGKFWCKCTSEVLLASKFSSFTLCTNKTYFETIDLLLTAVRKLCTIMVNSAP